MAERRTETYSVEFHRDPLTDEIKREVWFDPKTGKAHRPNGPAEVDFYEWEGRRCRSETFYNQGTIYREGDLPSMVVVDEETGTAVLQEWSDDGSPCRLGGKPAIILTDVSTGVVEREEYWEHGDRHRADGPAYIERNPKTGAILTESFYDRGEEVDPTARPPPSPS
ncbi:hypothetical protein [Gymnodinialimonas sp.]